MPRRRRRILVVEDNRDLVFGLKLNFEGEGFDVATAETLAEAEDSLKRQIPDLVILDIMLPDGNGLDLLAALRTAGNPVPVIILSAKGDELDKVAGLNRGADDYVSKPFSIAELIARLNARFRVTQRRNPQIEVGNIRIDTEVRTATKSGRIISLTEHEWRVLRVLLEEAGNAVSREELIRRAWGSDASVSTRNVDFFISSLRGKIEDDPATPRVILTCRGRGYMIIETES